ncbi:Uncharacterised protein [Mycobacteroides abscessus subsp. abscessus]|nr:Uncharacterised protein [Mycobacteroides abscessus subsp. abscessus]
MPTFRNVNTGQVVTVEADPSHLSGLARWERISEEPSALVTDPALPMVVFTQADFDQAQAALAQAQADEAAAARAAQQAQADLAQARADAEPALATAAAELSPNASDSVESARTPKRPADNADRKDWLAYAVARGKTLAELKGVRTTDIRMMLD